MSARACQAPQARRLTAPTARQQARALRTSRAHAGFDDGWPDAEIGAGLAAGAEIGDATEQLRLVMQRYRSLFNQICRP